MDVSKLFAGLGNTVSNIAHGIGNDFSAGVQNFQKQANSLLAPQQQQSPQQSPLQSQSVPLFVKPPQQQQAPNPFGGFATDQAPAAPSSPFVPTNPGTPPGQQASPPIVPPPSDQDALNSTLSFLENTAKSIVGGIAGFANQQGQNYMQGKNMLGQPMPYNMENNPFGAGAPHVDFTSGIQTGNPVGDFALKTLAGIPESIINAPSDEQAAQRQIIQDVQGGQITQPSVAASDVAGIALPIATIATLPEGGSVLESAGRQGIREALGQGALQGAKYGAGFGAGGAVAGNRNVTDPTQYAQNLLTGTGEGLGVGAVLGGGLAGAGRLAGGVPRTLPAEDFNKYGKDFATPDGQQALLGKIQQAAQAQPQFHDVLDRTAQEVNGRAISNIKTPTSIIGKVIDHQKAGESDYNLDSVNDVLRGTVEMPDKNALDQTLSTVKDNLDQNGWQIDNEQDFFKKPGPNNYQGYHLDISQPQADGTTLHGEIQIHTPDTYASARLTHDQYAQYGDNVPKPVAQQVKRLQAGIKNAPRPQVDAATQAKEVEQMPNTLSPVKTDYRVQEDQATQTGIVGQLQSQRDRLQAARLDPKEFPKDVQAMQAQRDNLKQQIDASKSIPRGTPKETRIALRNQADALQAQHDQIDTQVKSLQKAHRLNAKQQNARIDQSLQALDTRIQDEQGKAKAQAFVANRVQDQKDAFQAGKSTLSATKPLSDSEKQANGMPTLRKATLPAGKPGEGNIIGNNLGSGMFGRLKNSTSAGIRRIAYGLQDAKSWGDFQGQSRSYRLNQLAQGLTQEEKENAIDTVEGKAQPISNRVLQWAQAWDQERDQVFKSGKQSGLKTLYQKDYFPHTFDQATTEQIANDTKYQQAAIKAGYADSPESAANYLRRTGGRISPRELGSLHEHRLDQTNKYPYIKDPAVAENYLQNAYREIGYTSAFKPEMTEVTKVLKQERDNPEVNILKQALQEGGVTYNEQLSPEEKALKDATSGLRNFSTLTSLTPGTTPLSHIPALGHAAARLGPVNIAKALPAGARALFGKFTDEQRQNIARLSVDNTNKLYGGGNKMSKFYSAIGLNKTLNTLSAVVHDGAQSRMGWLEQNLQTPEAQRDIVKAGISYPDVLQRGGFTPAERYQYVNEALKDSSLELSGMDMPMAAQNAIGKVLFQFSGPEQQSVRRFVPFAAQELAKGNLGRKLAVGTGVAASVGLGMGAVGAKNLLADKPAQTGQQIAMEGTAQGLGIPGSSALVNSLEYPEYNYQTGVPAVDQIPGVDTALTVAGNTAGGPLLGKAQNALQIAQGVPIGQNPTPAQESLAARTVARNVPYIGPQLANYAFPAASYVGNRPTDVAQALVAGQPIQHGTGSFAYSTNPTIADLFRQNPTVTQQNNQLNQITQTKAQILANYNQSDQNNYNDIESQLQAPYTGTGNELNVKQGYGMLGNNTSARQIKSQVEVANAKINGTPVNPLWGMGTTNPDEQKAILLYKSYSPADQTAWKKIPANSQMYNDYQSQMSKYYSQNPSLTQTFQSAGLSAPAPSKAVSDALAAYDASKANGGKPNYALLDNNADVQSYFAGLDQFDNYVNGLMGLPQTAGSTTSSGSKGYSSSSSSSLNYLQRELDYQAMAEARSRIQVPKVNLAAGFPALQAIQAKPVNTNLAAGPKGGSIFSTAPKLSLQTAPKLTKYTIGKGVGRLNATAGPRPANSNAAPGPVTQLKIPA